ncbi:hypothetical protein AOB60_01675 [Streptomyces noursei]|uniref:Uncharacterized protein n=1 Tax=Streptomyces noursei TaxID=1971 RepID=A0A2N8PFR9_STRNR|nr:hypothetical protein AOB60_01675 [Streptomyces noursei]
MRVTSPYFLLAGLMLNHWSAVTISVSVAATKTLFAGMLRCLARRPVPGLPRKMMLSGAAPFTAAWPATTLP